MTDPLPIIAGLHAGETFSSGWRAFGPASGQHLAHLEYEIAGALEIRLDTHRLRSLESGIDIVLDEAAGTAPLAVEIKVWGTRSFGKNWRNRVNELLGTSVRVRRSFPGGTRLALVAILIDDEGTASSERLPSGASRSSHVAQQLSGVLSERRDGAGFDRVILGLAVERGSRWVSVTSDGAPAELRDFAEAMDQIAETARVKSDQAAPDPSGPGNEGTGLSPRILLVAGEWKSSKGGISTFNRDLAVAFAEAGCEVHVMLPQTDPTERDLALKSGVTLVVPPTVPGLRGTEALLTRPRFESDEYVPDVIVGHGRILGPYAYALQSSFFGQAKRVHFVHTDAELLESAKEKSGGPSRMLTAEERQRVETELAVSADLVAGVGPLLAESIEHAMRGWPHTRPRVLNFLPGLRDWGATVDPADVSPRRQVLLVARAEDMHSKGIHIAVSAMLKVVERLQSNRYGRPILVVRGVPADEADAVKARIDEILSPHVEVVLRRYSTDETALKLDLWQSRVVVMPSRHEGFGLAAYEAIAAAVPVLVSADSGLARLLIEKVHDGERGLPREVLPVRGDDDAIVETWANALVETLRDPEAAFSRAAFVRRALAADISWEDSVQQVLCALGSHRSHNCAVSAATKV
ncbi:hypothetical protein Aab01nite_14550 [Paractinoplanes abujensis]|uniref:Glycosyltransferase involved in cell wall biosynthesis n=1 Tax=Paractinoplanes abujensis TaxID=882441 RepID=A0A7W7CLK5_9ACTN|nr:glycosyltransferase family 4 protein [Actinoplanes abujensis]MBB4690722.1 glycosyltransferase involved in cell wall biosynthesis [Actinoplanes abujensis]GID17865.1 hypothetical protein Aab01nite_14550 [Actinoplanes abujensis]